MRSSVAPALLVALVLLLYLRHRPVYRDAPLSRLGTRVGERPLRGLLTSVPKRALPDDLGRDLDGVDARCTIAFFDDFPAGYLLTDARPDTNAVWTATVPQRLTVAYHDDLVRYYLHHGFPDVVVLMRAHPLRATARARGASTTLRGDPLLVALRSHGYRLSARRLDYVVYRRAALLEARRGRAERRAAGR